MIESLTNEKIKRVAKLNQKRYRDEMNQFVIEGWHLIEEAKAANVLLEVFTIDPSIEGTLISLEVMKKLTGLDSLPKVIGVASQKTSSIITDKVLVLDGVQDPGNLGTLLRSAKAFGFDTILLGKGTCDPYSPKVVRSTQGAIFTLNISHNVDLTMAYQTLKDKGYTLYATRLEQAVPLQQVKPILPFALILGSEGQGISDVSIQEADECVKIHMQGTESLNVAVAGSIIMHAWQ